MSFEEYAQIPAINWSSLKPFRDSAADALYAAHHEREPSSAMNLGSAVDVSIFEPERLLSDFTVYRESKSKGEGARKNWETFQAANAGRTILTVEEWQRAIEIGRSVRDHKVAREVFDHGVSQDVLVWKDKASGLWMKCRQDWRRDRQRFADLKTARSINQFKFQAQAWGLGYFHQLEVYRRGIAATEGCSVDAVVSQWVVVRNTPPYPVMVAEPDSASMDQAAIEVSDMLERLAECRRSGKWPGPADDEVVTLHAPRYALPDDEALDDLIFGGNDDARESVGAE